MKLSNMHLKTLREIPNEAEIDSHRLLIRSGMIKKLVSGIYGFMPMGWRIVRKIEDIVRNEMDSSGAQEIHMSALQPSELWEESGRWYAYGPELFRLKDRNGRDFCLGPTHEEIFTDIVRNEIDSYRQLPINLYQIQTKYRDEARPRFGLMRSREFIMKDAYSFDIDEAGLDVSYNKMFDAYTNIFNKCGLTFRPVEADTGAIGGSNSHEFVALSDVGESEIAYCTKCDMASTVERAECRDDKPESDEMLMLEDVHTPDIKTIVELSEYVNVPSSKTIKALMFVTYDKDQNENGFVTAFVRGDRDLNMTKLINALDIPEHAIEFYDESKSNHNTNAVAGFTGPIGLEDTIMVVDSELVGMRNMVAGANKKDYHIKNVNYGRDYEANIIKDIKTLKEGDNCPNCGVPVSHARGIEVGQVFKLGTKYSESMGAKFKNESQVNKDIVMGCYGIGVTRTLAAVVEQFNDENGIIWPMSVAPYHVIITLVKVDDEVQSKVASEIYEKLISEKIEVLLDDRDERPGVKFKDADLIGIPIRITVGKLAGEGKVEYKLRRDVEKTEEEISVAIQKAIELVRSES